MWLLSEYYDSPDTPRSWLTELTWSNEPPHWDKRVRVCNSYNSGNCHSKPTAIEVVGRYVTVVVEEDDAVTINGEKYPEVDGSRCALSTYHHFGH